MVQQQTARNMALSHLRSAWAPCTLGATKPQNTYISVAQGKRHDFGATPTCLWSPQHQKKRRKASNSDGTSKQHTKKDAGNAKKQQMWIEDDHGLCTQGGNMTLEAQQKTSMSNVLCCNKRVWQEQCDHIDLLVATGAERSPEQAARPLCTVGPRVSGVFWDSCKQCHEHQP